MTDTDIQFASLLASRLCHDLVNPAGALNTGLDVLATESDADMREHAQRLVAESTSRLLAMIEFARVAYGASGGPEGSLSSEDLRTLAEKLFKHQKPSLVWSLPPRALPKLEGRALLNLLLLCERMVPRPGSEVRVEPAGASFSVTCTGPRARLPEDIEAAFAGAQDPEPKVMPARLAKALADQCGKAIIAELGEEKVVLFLR